MTSHEATNEVLTRDEGWELISEDISIPKGEEIQLRLRQGETIQHVSAFAEETVAAFKKRVLPDSTAAAKHIRLIHAGKLLLNGTTFGRLNLAPDTVLHCVITENAPPEEAADVSHSFYVVKHFIHSNPFSMLLWLSGLILCLLWSLFFVAPEDFTVFSRIVMVLLSAIHCIGCSIVMIR